MRSLQLILLPPATQDFTAHHKTTTKRGSVSVQGIAAQFIYNAICDNLGRLSGNSAEIVPLMKTNWRNQGSFLLPSQEAIPNNMKLPKPRSSFAQKEVKNPWKGRRKQNPSEDLTLLKGEYQQKA